MVYKMVKRYQIELDRNERDFKSFIKRRDVSLSRRDMKVLIAARSINDTLSFFDTESFRKKINALRNGESSSTANLREKMFLARTVAE